MPINWEIIGARKVTVKGEEMISLRLQRITKIGAKMTTNIHIDLRENYKELVGEEIEMSLA